MSRVMDMMETSCLPQESKVVTYEIPTNPEEVNRVFRDTMIRNEVLLQENRVLQSHLNRKLRAFGVSREMKGARVAPAQTLSITQKINLAQAELTHRQRDLAELDQRATKEVAGLQAMLGESQARIHELKKESSSFRRDIVIGGVDPRTSKVMAEKVIKHFEDSIARKSDLVDKIRHKNMQLKNQITKLDKQLKAKEEQGDPLNSIDFHQLQIENSQFNQKIKERNDELMKLKMTTGKTVQKLNQAKKTLNELLSDQSRLKLSIVDREETLQRLSEEFQRIENEVEMESKKNVKFKKESGAEIPQILDYVTQKATLHEFQKKVKNWKRKVEIAEVVNRGCLSFDEFQQIAAKKARQRRSRSDYD